MICGPYVAKKMFKKSGGNIYQFLKERARYHNVDISNNPDQSDFREGWFNRLKDLEKNMNELVNKGYYIPPYQNEITPFDNQYKGSLNIGNLDNLSKEERQNKRNKYLYLVNKNKENYAQKAGKNTGYAAPESSSVKLFASNQSVTKSEKTQTPSQNFSDIIRQQYKSQVDKTNKKFNLNFRSHNHFVPTGRGHWVNINGAHIFIED